MKSKSAVKPVLWGGKIFYDFAISERPVLEGRKVFYGLK